MRRQSTFYKKLVITLVIVVLCVGLARLTSLFTGGVFVNELLAPVQGVVMRSWHGVGDYFEYIGNARGISDENKELRSELRELTWENNRLQEVVYENERLLGLLNFQEQNADKYTLLGARVISRTPNILSNMVVIDRGTQDGVQKEMVAVSNAGLVGKVIAVGPSSAEVLLMLDREFAAGALVQGSRTPGIVEGTEEEPGLLRMISLPYDARLQQGEMVVTSGMGGIFPPGLPMGNITTVEGSGINKVALVQPLVDFDRLEELFLITDVKSE